MKSNHFTCGKIPFEIEILELQTNLNTRHQNSVVNDSQRQIAFLNDRIISQENLNFILMTIRRNWQSDIRNHQVDQSLRSKRVSDKHTHLEPHCRPIIQPPPLRRLLVYSAKESSADFAFELSGHGIRIILQ